MNIDRILESLNSARVDFILIGGVNFLLRHGGPLTYDLDIWVEGSDENLHKLVKALNDLNAEWGATEATWARVKMDIGWLKQQTVFCLITREGGLDIFREVRGLEGKYEECKSRAIPARTKGDVQYLGLSDRDMLQTQLALELADRKLDRISILRKAMES